MQAYGIKLQLSGQLIGPDPGRLEATTSWEMPAENLTGSGSFSGNIEKLGFRHLVNTPEAVNFNGSIYHLFTKPELAGVADWSSIHLPVQKTLYSNAGNITVSSNFRSAHLKGNNILLLEDWPKAPMQLDALIDLQGVRIDSYSLETLDGQVRGSGQIDYSDGLQGKLVINATQINTGIINSDLPGQLEFNSSLQIESADVFAINVDAAKAEIANRDFTGLGRVLWSGGKLTAINANINAGTNQLTADIKTWQAISRFG
ncbi:MAG: hypothetical protein GQ573_00980 [Gammaproteobacteria bacterium]|nr:hypothetical protein [Gammaproteobacteria bacterium]